MFRSLHVLHHQGRHIALSITEHLTVLSETNQHLTLRSGTHPILKRVLQCFSWRMERNFVLYDHVGSNCFSLKEEGSDVFYDFASMQEALEEVRCRSAPGGGTVMIVTWSQRSTIHVSPEEVTQSPEVKSGGAILMPDATIRDSS